MSLALRRTFLVALVALAGGLTACGGSSAPNAKIVQGINTDDAHAVAKAWKEAQYRCGEEGSGLAWDLDYQPGKSRQEFLDSEKKSGCVPRAVPQIDVILSTQQGDAVSAQIVVVGDPDKSVRVNLVHTEKGWRVT